MMPCSWTKFSAGEMSPSAPQHQRVLSKRAKPNSVTNSLPTFGDSWLRRMASRANTDLACVQWPSGAFLRHLRYDRLRYNPATVL